MSRLLENLSTDIVRAAVDFREYPEKYYFRDANPKASLAATLTYAVDLGRIWYQCADGRRSSSRMTLEYFAR